MNSRDSGGWLEAVLVRAEGAGWCVQPCSLCQCLEFRRGFWAAAARQAGVAGGFESAQFPRDIFAGVSDAERELLVRTLVVGLRELPPTWCNSQAFRTIILDLYPPLLLHGVWMALDTELSGTPAGEALTRMHAHWRRRQVDQSPQAVEERRRVKRENRAIAHASRQAETRRRNAERLKLLEALAYLSPADRLGRFATDPALRLDCVSAELIPAEEGDLIDLEKAKAVALITRICRRKGPWGRLRRMLEHRVRAEAQ